MEAEAPKARFRDRAAQGRDDFLTRGVIIGADVQRCPRCGEAGKHADGSRRGTPVGAYQGTCAFAERVSGGYEDRRVLADVDVGFVGAEGAVERSEGQP